MIFGDDGMIFSFVVVENSIDERERVYGLIPALGTSLVATVGAGDA